MLAWKKKKKKTKKNLLVHEQGNVNLDQMKVEIFKKKFRLALTQSQLRLVIVSFSPMWS